MNHHSRSLRVAALVAATLLAASGARAQEPKEDWDGARPGITRAALEELKSRYESAAESSAYSTSLRARARVQAEAIKARLTDGDFQAGDRVAISVDGQEAMTNTFDVGNGRVVLLPGVGNVSLNGVLRSELEPRITQSVARVIRDPIVHVRTLIRLAVSGEIIKPGYYSVPLDALVTDALMLAGGPTAKANLNNLSIERGNTQLYSGEALQQAIIDGKTLNQLNLRPGDRIAVGTQQQHSVGELVRLAIVGVPSVLFALSQITSKK